MDRLAWFLVVLFWSGLAAEASLHIVEGVREKLGGLTRAQEILAITISMVVAALAVPFSVLSVLFWPRRE